MTSDLPKNPVVIDLFAGAGGLSLGFQSAGFNVAGAVELDPIHAAVHRHNFPRCTVIESDVSEINGPDILQMLSLNDLVVSGVIGGPPCQGFSNMGHRNPDDPRNKLIFDFARIVAEIRPSFFVMENVQGLLSPRNSPLVDEFINQMERTGYHVTTPVRYLDASDYGVPQARKRAFFVGFLDPDIRWSYPEPLSTHVTVWDAIGDLSFLDDIQSLTSSDNYTAALPPAHSTYAESLRWSGNLTGCRRTVHSMDVLDRFRNTAPGEVEPVSRYRRLYKEGISPTLRAGTGSDRGSYTAARPIHPIHHRCITVREAARLHSYPDWFQFHPSTWHGFREVGNSVPPLLAQAVAASVLRSLTSTSLLELRECVYVP